MDGARDVFWIKSQNGTFLALQIKAFSPKKIKFHAWVKKCHFGNFTRNPNQDPDPEKQPVKTSWGRILSLGFLYIVSKLEYLGM